MYADQDGAATKQSQAVYDQRISRLLLAISTLSVAGFASAALNGEYTENAFEWKLSIWGLHVHPSGPLLWPIMCLNSLNLYRKSRDALALYRGGLAGALLALIFVFSAIRALDWGRQETGLAPPALTQIVCAALLVFLQILIPRRPDIFTPDGRRTDAENSVCALSRHTLSWCLPALETALYSDSIESLPALNFASRASSQSVLASPSHTPYVWRYILDERLTTIVKQVGLAFTRTALDFGPSFFINHLLSCLETSRGTPAEAWLWLLAIGACETLHAIVHTQTTFTQWSQSGIVVNSQLINSIFAKLLRRKNAPGQDDASKSSIPEINTLVSSDAAALARFSAVGYIIISLAAKSILTVVLLYRLLGWQSTLVAIIATLTSMTVDTHIVKKTTAARKQSIASRGETTAVLKEALYALREIKFSSLEPQWEAHIDEVRQRELGLFRRRRFASMVESTWDTASPILVATVSVCTFILFGGEVTPAIIFPMVSMLPKLESSLSFLPQMFAMYDRSVDTANNIDKYLSAPEKSLVLESSPSGQVCFENATIAWPSDQHNTMENEKPKLAQDQFALRDLNLVFPTAELSVVSGRTGAGKSLLLAAILGEVDLHAGQIAAPSAADDEPVAFVAQSPWLQNCTIRQNILFGSPFHEQRYQKVIKACALESDLAALPDGDQTQIGLRGVKLSGGQKARLSFARGLYSDATLMVLDDIFSALDTHVAKHIFSALNGELCQGRTRVLVTHHVSLCLPRATYHVHLDNNTVAYAGAPQLKDDGFKSLDVEKTASELAKNEKPPEAEKPKPTTLTAPIKISKPEKTAFHFYRRYFDAAGGITFIIAYAVGLIANEALAAWGSYLFGHIKSAMASSDRPSSATTATISTGNDFSTSIYWYLLIAFASIGLVAVTNLLSTGGILRASNILFRRMTFNVLRMPLHWIDTTSFGEIIKTFTVDTRNVDDQAIETVANVAGNVVKLTTIVCIGLSISKYISLLTMCLIAWCVRIGTRYVKARSRLRLGGSVYMADILEHIASTSAGLTTIRSFGAQRQFIKTMQRYIDTDALSHRHFWVFHDWVALQLFLVGTVFTMVTNVSLLSSKAAVNTSAVGFSLTFFGQLHRAIFMVINQVGHLSMLAEAMESVVEYTELETEKLDGVSAAEEWPENGTVEAQELEVAYAADLPPVLKSLTFTAKAGKRIGIVGRTGAGKSSLTLSLLRLLEPRGGRVLIDDIDISTLRVADLRSRVAFIPQDPTLFSGTIRSNLDYFQKTPIKEIEDALRCVGLLADDEDESSGLFAVDSPVSAGGANMSQGQRQLLCLARILIRNPKIMILDEATSAVDNRTDSMIQEVIRTHFTGTLIVVAHRLRTIASFDMILVINDGSIVEQGMPRELMERKGAFYELVKSSQDFELLEKLILGFGTAT